jgi:hypothetical protein
MPDALPRFPETRPLTPGDRDWYNAFYGTLPPYSDQSFGNLLVWGNLHGDLSVSRLEDAVVFVSTDPFTDTGDPLVVLLGPSICQTMVNRVFDVMPALSSITVCGELSGIPGAAQTLGAELDRDNSDYLYDIEEHLALVGPRYKKLRNGRRRFLAEVGDLEVAEVDLVKPSSRDRLLTLTDHWARRHPPQNDPERLERRALTKLLSICRHVAYRAFELRVGSRTVAFSICQPVPQPGAILMGHLKCDYDYAAIFDAAFHSTLERLMRCGYHTLNLEQDLGRPGLRLHKSLLRPRRLLERFLVYRAR